MTLKHGAKAFVIYNQKILLILRDNKPDIPNPNTWNFPGGGIEEGEEPLETLKRELEEEISIIPKNIHWLGKTTYVNQVSVYRYIIWLDQNEYEELKLGDEGQRMEFFNLSKVIKLKLSLQTRQYIEKTYQQIEAFINNPKSLQPFDTII
jgi:8-oxo-dGTP diphosphatase